MSDQQPSTDDRMVACVVHTRGLRHGTTSLYLGGGAFLLALVPHSGVALPAAIYGITTFVPLVLAGVAMVGAVSALRCSRQLGIGERVAFEELPLTRLRLSSFGGLALGSIGACLSMQSLVTMEVVSRIPL